MSAKDRATYQFSRRPAPPIYPFLPGTPPLDGNYHFHFLENLPRPIILCAPKKVSILPVFHKTLSLSKKRKISLQVGSMTFFWSFPSHLDQADSRSWVEVGYLLLA